MRLVFGGGRNLGTVSESSVQRNTGDRHGFW